MGTGSLPEDFPMAICRMLVTPTPVVQRGEGTIQEWYGHSLLISQGTQELVVLAIVLCQRHEQWMEGLGQAFPGARDLLEEMGLDPVSMSGVKWIFLASYCNTSSLSWLPESHSGIAKVVFVFLSVFVLIVRS